MIRKLVWLAVSGLMGLSLVMTACGTAEVEEEGEVSEEEVVTAETPKYGGTLTKLTRGGKANKRFDSILHSVMGSTLHLTNQPLWAGDWTKGNAGGYGTGETDWSKTSFDIFAHKAGYLAENIEWSADIENDVGTLVYKVRQGVHWALNPDSEASQLVGGREMTADDVVHSLKRVIASSKAYVFRANPPLREAEITKSGPWEVTVKVPVSDLMVAVTRFGDSTYIQPPEVIEKYGDMEAWENSVGTGPFILTDLVPGSSSLLVRNGSYWMTDPIGPGKGNQLPYLDAVKLLVVPDLSTQQAALRTAKIDQMEGFSWEDAVQMRQMTPELIELEWAGGRESAAGMRTDIPPFNDVRVRQALMMATDFNDILQGLYEGRGQILTWPSASYPEYADLYLGLDDPEMPAVVKELYVYNPERAKELLTEAGYPNGFETSILVTASQVDFVSIWKDMWAKVGIELAIDVRESAAVSTLKNDGTFPGLAFGGGADATMYLTTPHLQGEGQANVFLRPEDPIINKALDQVRRAALTDEKEAMGLYKEMMKYVLEQAYAIPRAQSPQSNFWWPWLKNYSGEAFVGYFDASWPQWIWYDEELKKSMGH